SRGCAILVLASFIGWHPVDAANPPGAADPAPGGRLLLVHAQLHHLGRLTADGLLDTIGPALQSDADLVGVVVLLVAFDDATRHPGNVIEVLLGDGNRSAEFLQATGTGPAQIVQAPAVRRDLRFDADPNPDLVPAGDRFLPIGAEHVGTASEPRLYLDQCPSLRAQGKLTFAVVLRSLARQDPNATLVVDLGPLHPADLVAPRPGQ